MKKIVLILFVIWLLCGCSGKDNIEKSVKNTISIIEETRTGNSAVTIESENLFWSSDYQCKYKIKTDAGLEFIEGECEIKNIKLITFDEGIVYELITNAKDEKLNDISLGFYYVTPKKIYRIYIQSEELEKVKSDKKNLLKRAQIVCQKKEKKDKLEKDKKGDHWYINVNGNIREYHYWNSRVDTGYFEQEYWKKNEGLIFYRTGYGAERDLVELTKINKNQ